MSGAARTFRQKQEFEQAPEAVEQTAAWFEHEQRHGLDAAQRFLHGNPAVVAVIVLLMSILIFGMMTGGKFFSPFNLSLIMQQVSTVGILAAAQSLVILTAGIDLSVGAIMVLMSVIMGQLTVTFGVSAPIAIVIGFAGGTAAGMLNGFLITWIRLPPFIVTFGSWNIFFALNLWLSGARSIRSQTLDEVAPLLKVFGKSIAFGGARVTYGSILMLVIFGVLYYILNHTRWGRHVYAVGDDREAAGLAGVRTNRILIMVYGLAGLICAIAAWASIGRLGAVSPQSFQDANLQSITAVVIGGISLFGGRGSVIGTLIGALIVGTFNSGLRLVGVDVLWQIFAIGWLTIAAVAIDQWIRRVSA